MAVSRSIIGMRGMLIFYWKRMVQAPNILDDVIWHGEIDIFLIIIPFQLNPTENFTITIKSDVLVFLKFIDYMASTVFSKKKGAKVVNNKIEHYWSCEATTNSWCVSCGEITFISKVFYWFYIRKTSYLWETVQACSAFS